MVKKRAAGGGRKEADHQIRLAEMARLILNRTCSSPQKAARLVAVRVVGLGDTYDWLGEPRVRNVDTLARRLKVHWARRGRGDAILAAERALREGRRRSTASWPDADAIRDLHAQGRSLSSLFPPALRGLSAEQIAMAEWGLDRRQMLIPPTSVSSLYPETDVTLHPVRAISGSAHPDDTPEKTAFELVVQALEKKVGE